MRVIQKQAGQILLSIFLAGSCFAADLRAADTLSIATQIASPTDTLRQTYDHHPDILVVSQVVYGAAPTRQDAACQPKIPFQI